LLAAALVVLAGWTATRGPAIAPGVAVVALTHDLTLGAVLGAQDVRSVRLAEPPDGALTDAAVVVGRRLAGAARRGEVLTNLRLVDNSGPDPGQGRAAIAVRPADPALLQLLQPGMTVAVVGVSTDGAAATLSSDALVLAVLQPAGDRSTTGQPVLLSVAGADADRVTAATLAGDIALRLT
jgi:hypothetical protein